MSFKIIVIEEVIVSVGNDGRTTRLVVTQVGYYHMAGHSRVHAHGKTGFIEVLHLHDYQSQCHTGTRVFIQE